MKTSVSVKASVLNHESAMAGSGKLPLIGCGPYQIARLKGSQRAWRQARSIVPEQALQDFKLVKCQRFFFGHRKGMAELPQLFHLNADAGPGA